MPDLGVAQLKRMDILDTLHSVGVLEGGWAIGRILDDWGNWNAIVAS